MKIVPGTLNLRIWEVGDSSQSNRAVEVDDSLKIGGWPHMKRLKGYPKILSAIDISGITRDKRRRALAEGIISIC